MTIDMHAHWRPPEMADALRARTEMPRIERDSDGDEVLVGPRGPQKLDKAFDDVDARLASMDAHGIDAAMISILLPAWRRKLIAPLHFRIRVSPVRVPATQTVPDGRPARTR